MDFHVSVQIARFCECLVALVAHKWFLSCVCSNVNFENVLPCKFGIALVTCKWSVISVLALIVVLQMTLSSEALQTLSALMWLISQVAVLMVLQTGLLIVELATTLCAVILFGGFQLSKI